MAFVLWPNVRNMHLKGAWLHVVSYNVWAPLQKSLLESMAWCTGAQGGETTILSHAVHKSKAGLPKWQYATESKVYLTKMQTWHALHYVADHTNPDLYVSLCLHRFASMR